MDDLLIGEQKYVSSKRAAELTGYAKDYIGQLCREGRVEARLVGRSWYVREAAIKDHRFGLENASPAVVQTKSVIEASNDMEPPIYKVDVPTVLPTAEEPIEDEIQEVKLTNENIPLQDRIMQMQEAWQAWFSQNTPIDQQYEAPQAIEINKVSPEPEIEPERQVEISRIADIEPVFDVIPEEPVEEVALDTLSTPVHFRVQRTPYLTPRSHRNYFAFKISLIICAVIVASIALVGTGTLEDRAGIESTAGVFNFVSGARTYNK